MTRFAGSPVDFTPASLQSAASGGNYSSAAAAVDLGAGFASMREKAPKYDALSAEAMKNQAAERISAMEAESEVNAAGITSFGKTKGDALQAKATIEAAKAQADARKQSAMFGAIGGVVSSGLKLFTGGLA